MLVDPNGPTPVVSGAIRKAARMTGADFQYLLATAQVESNFNPNAQGATSSAKGLFQFIDQTWLATLKESGPALGYGVYSNAIGRNASGQYAVTDPRLYNRIMNLRSDPTANSVMAGAFTASNASKLAERLGRKPSEGELYVAHFLGPTGASRLIELAQSKPGARAADMFPTAAATNPTIFHDRRGRARSVGEVYQTLVGRYQGARANAPAVPAVAPAVPATATAAATAPTPTPTPQPRPVPPPAAVAAIESTRASQRRAFAPDATEIADTYATAARLTAPEPVDNRPVFHGLFRSNGRPEPLAPIVSSLWSTTAAQNKPQPLDDVRPPAAPVAAAPAQRPAPTPVAAPPTPVAAPNASGAGPLDLFQESIPDARALFRGRV